MTGRVRESFHTVDEVYFPAHGIHQLPYTSERGTTCCIRIADPRHGGDSHLWVGVSHVKIPNWKQIQQLQRRADLQLRQYTSRFYAFEAVAPYRVVAVSGRFCLPPPDESEVNDHPYTRYVLDRNVFRFNHTDLRCPMITFVSGMVEAVDDPDTVVLGYGINDCIPRLIKVPKRDIVRLLFGDDDDDNVS